MKFELIEAALAGKSLGHRALIERDCRCAAGELLFSVGVPDSQLEGFDSASHPASGVLIDKDVAAENLPYFQDLFNDFKDSWAVLGITTSLEVYKIVRTSDSLWDDYAFGVDDDGTWDEDGNPLSLQPIGNDVLEKLREEFQLQ